jgi:hypothetical protein
MALPHDLRLPGRLEVLRAVLPDRLQQPIAALRLPLFHDHQRLVHELREEVEDVGSWQLAVGSWLSAADCPLPTADRARQADLSPRRGYQLIPQRLRG